MEDGDTMLQDHINKSNQLACQLLNADEKITDQEKALLLLASLPKSFKLIVMTMLVGREKISLDEAITVVRENERMMVTIDGDASSSDGVLVAASNERGRRILK